MTQLASRPRYETFKFSNPGTTITGSIVDFGDVQMTVYKSNPPRPATWDDGRPKMQTRVCLQTEAGNEESRRNIWVKPGRMMKAVAAAVSAAGAKDIEVDGILTVTFTHREQGEGQQDAHCYEAKYEPPFDPTA